MTIPASIEGTFLGIMHVHARLCDPKGEWDCKNHKPEANGKLPIHFTLVPGEGSDWVRAQFFSMEDDGTCIPAQVELKLMEWGFEATWLWDVCQDTPFACFLGQFGREGTRKAVSDSGAYRFNGVSGPRERFPTR